MCFPPSGAYSFANMKKLVGFCCLCLLLCAAARADLRRETVTYYEGGATLEGFLSYDNAVAGRRPAVMVIHEWNGISDYIRSRCDQLAALGYVAFAADIYGRGIRPANPQDSAKQAMIYYKDRGLMRRRAAAGLDWLKNHRLADQTKIAVIGYCFGGGVALELARSGADFSGVCSFHGTLDPPHPEETKHIVPKVLVQTGADDPNVPFTRVGSFEDEMRGAGADWYLISYGNAVHRFTNPEAGNDNSKGAAYNEKADRRSWQAMKDFFAELFGR